ncbi:MULTISPECIES: alpha/beta fold hydrolase [Frankia]|uniref:alpha/beta fold hydrolase n=1 Tax=Frankia TaxID=1854 RepID=UPI0002E19BAA|nr:MULTISPECIES: alpha/beta fold hydrolase [Frankia]
MTTGTGRADAMAAARVTWVLIPGAGGASWYWHLVARRLAEAGGTVVAVDLPAADERAGLPEYADATVAAVTTATPTTGATPATGVTGATGAAVRPGADGAGHAASGGGEVVVVAASLGAFVAPLVCERLPVSLVVLVNGMIPLPGETPGAWWEATGQPAARRASDLRAGRPPDADFDATTYFFHDLPAPLAAQASAGEPTQSEAVFGSRLLIDAWPPVPTRVLVGRDDRFFPAQFQRRVARERLGLSADEIPGGHLVALANPSAVTARLLSYAEAALGPIGPR